MGFKDKSRTAKIWSVALIMLVLYFIFLGMFADRLFKNEMLIRTIDNSIGKFFDIFGFITNNYVTIIESLVIIFFVWLLDKVLVFLVGMLTLKGHRSETIAKLFSSTVSYVAMVVAIVLILSAWGVQEGTLLAGAGILALALSFGAQSLIEDVISGLFIIFERQFIVGDFVQIGNAEGVVKDIGIRVTKVENYNGDISIINNSDIRWAMNKSSAPSLAILDLSVAYGEDIEKVETIIKDNLDDIRSRLTDIKEGPYYKGVQSLEDSAVIFRIVAKTDEPLKHQLIRDMNKEFKMLLDKHGIEIPFPQIVVRQPKK
jgi:moderate conductance mechanosensitive channel